MFQDFADLITYNVFHLVPGDRLASSVNFFIYDVIKIYSLIFTVLFIISLLQTFLPISKMEEFLCGKKGKFYGYFIASFMGAVSPFCSCSSIPLFVGFLKARIPLGVSFAFLVTSPLVNEVVLVMMGGLFGWKVAIIYALSGIVLGIMAGIVLDILKLEKEILVDGYQGQIKIISEKELPSTYIEKLNYAKNDTIKTFMKLWWIIIVGVAFGALLHGYVPQELIMDVVSKFGIYAVPMAVIIGIPIYAGCSAVVPVIFSITSAGIPLGTSLAFLMSIAGLSLPEALMLKKLMTIKLLLVFYGIVAVGIIIIGYLFNLIF